SLTTQRKIATNTVSSLKTGPCFSSQHSSLSETMLLFAVSSLSISLSRMQAP
ncbi:unnamed protein product, partial [Gulo gulo]